MECLDKNILRNLNINKRLNMTFKEKEEKDIKIYDKLISLNSIKTYDFILSYVSVKFEVDTLRFIKFCLKNNKKIYLPVCDKEKKELKFYSIDSINDLHLTNFSLLEPLQKEEKRCVFRKNFKYICITPAIAYNFYGYRVGYGKGFYDRFFSKHDCLKIGLCYDFNLEKSSFNEKFDVAVDFVLTENKILKIT